MTIEPRILTTVAALLLLAGVVLTHAQDSQPTDPSTEAENDSPALVVEEITTNIRIEQDGRVVAELHSITRILNDQGKQTLSQLYWPFKENLGSVDLRLVRTIKPTGENVDTDLTTAQIITPPVARANPVFTDLRYKVLPVAALNVGDRLEVDLALRIDRPIIAGEFWWPQRLTAFGPVLKEVVVLDLPEDREVSLTHDGNVPMETEIRDGRVLRTWTLESEEPVTRKPDLLFSVSSLTSWNQVAHWLEALMADRKTLTPELATLARDLTEGLDDRDKKIAALFSEVAFTVRYVSISLGLGSYQPHAAAEVWRNKYGDCKDKHTLLSVLLKANGIEAYPALVNTAVEVNPDVPSPGEFDHMITAIPQGDGWLFLDSSSGSSPGYVPMQLRGKRALVLRGDESELVTLPRESPVLDSVSVVLKGSINDLGTLEARARREYRGLLEPTLRQLAALGDDSRLSPFLGTGLWFAELDNIDASDPRDFSKPFVVEHDMTREALFDPFGDDGSLTIPGLAINPSILRFTTFNEQPLPVGPVEFYDRMELSIPPAKVRLPPSIVEDGEFWSYAASYRHEGNLLVIERRLQIGAGVVSTDLRDEWESIYGVVETDLEKELIIELDSPPDATRVTGELGSLALLSAGAVAFRAKDWDRAIEIFEAAVEKTPDDPDIYMMLAGAYVFAGLNAEAEEALDRAVTLSPDDEGMLFQLGVTQYFLGNHEAAVKSIEKVLELGHGDVETRLLLATAYVKLEEWAPAEEHLTHALKLEPNRADALVMLARAQLCQNKPDVAEVSINAALELGGGPQLFDWIASALIECGGDAEKALQYADEAVARAEFEIRRLRSLTGWKPALYSQSALGSYLATYGRGLERQGRGELAHRYLAAALKLYPTTKIALYLAEAYASAEDEDEALYYLAVAHILSESEGTPPPAELTAFGEQRFPNETKLQQWVDRQRGRYAVSHLIDVEDGVFSHPDGERDQGQHVVRCAALVDPGGQVLDVQVMEGDAPWAEEARAGIAGIELEPIAWSDSPVPSIRIVVVTFGPGPGIQVRYALMNEVARLTKGFQDQKEAAFLEERMFPF